MFETTRPRICYAKNKAKSDGLDTAELDVCNSTLADGKPSTKQKFIDILSGLQDCCIIIVAELLALYVKSEVL